MCRSPSPSRSRLLLSLCVLLCVSSFLIQHVRSHAAGADMDACTDQNPFNKRNSAHYYAPSDDTSAYLLRVTPEDYIAGGEPLTVTLSSPTGLSFKGFLISALPSGTTPPYTSKRRGTWTTNTNSQLVCEEGAGQSAITHRDAWLKRSITLQWNPPTVSGMGKMTFTATIMKDVNSIYFTTFEVIETIPGKPTAPSAPALPTLTVEGSSNTSIGVAWTAPRRNGTSAIASYTLEIDTGTKYDTSTYIQGDTRSISAGFAYNGIITGLSPAHYYRIRVYAVNAQGAKSDPSPVLVVRTLDANPVLPDAVVFSTAPLNVSTTHVHLNWTMTEYAKHNATLVQFIVERIMLTQNGQTIVNSTWIRVYAGLAPKMDDTTVLPNSTYQFRVSPVTLAGRGPATVINVATPDCPSHCSYQGMCTPTGECRCNPGYLGSDCSLGPTPVNCLGHGRICIEVKTAADQVYVRMTGRTLGWFGVILNPSQYNGMVGGDAWIANTGQLPITVDDRFSTGRTAPQNDDIFSLRNIISWQNATHTTVTFTRRLDVGNDTQDVPIVPVAGDRMRLSWAIGSSNIFVQHAYTDHGKGMIDWSAGTIDELPNDLAYGSFYLPPLGALFIVMAIGIMLQRPRIYRSALGRFFLRRKIGRQTAPTWFDAITFGLRPAFWDLGYGEALVVGAYAVAVAGLILIGFTQLASINRHPYYILGHATALHIALSWLPVTRNSIWLGIFGISFERAIRWHRWVSRASVAFMYAHCFVNIGYIWDWDFRILTSQQATHQGYGVAYGYVSLCIFSTLFVLAFEPVRRYAFEVFYYSHLTASRLGTFFAMVHSIVLRWFMLVPLMLYVVDKLLQSSRTWMRETKIVGLQLLADDGVANHALSKLDEHTSGLAGVAKKQPRASTITKITLKVDHFAYNAGDYCFINIPALSWFESHPFSISSCPGRAGDHITLHVLDVGTRTFTHRLAELARRMNNADAHTLSKLQVRLDGPYGNLAVPVHEYPVIVLCAGGIGITPLMSVLTKLYADWSSGVLANLTGVHLIWVCSSPSAFTTWFPHELSRIASAMPIFNLHLYCTARTSEVLREDGLSLNDYSRTRKDSEISSLKQLSGKDSPLYSENHASNGTGSTPMLNFQMSGTTPTNLRLRTDSLTSNGSDGNNRPPTPDHLAVTRGLLSPAAAYSMRSSFTSNGVDVESGGDPLTIISSLVRDGRPDYGSLFGDIKMSIKGNMPDRPDANGKLDMIETPFAGPATVLACGPPDMIGAVKQHAINSQFHWHQETFVL